MLEIVKNTIYKYGLVQKGDGIVVGVSGGADSLSLLYALNSLKEELNLRLVVVHLNHLFREDAYLDAEYVREVCEKLGIKSYIFEKNITKLSEELSMSFEEAGRFERYRLFREVMDKENLNKIAIAQNRNDQAETVFMRILRGAGLRGLIGIEYKRKDNVIRPLLDVRRELIDKYCLEHGLSPRQDYTNFQDIYFRNKIRLNLIPFIEKKFGIDIIEKLANMSNILREDEKFLMEYSLNKYKNIVKYEGECLKLDIKKLNEFSLSIKRRIIRNFIEEAKGNINDLSYNDVESILSLMKKVNGSKYFWKNFVIEREYNYLVMYSIFEFDTSKSVDWKINSKEMLKDEYDDFIKDKSSLEYLEYKKSRLAFFDLDTLKGNLKIRFREEGDKFKPLGMKGKKKINRFFIDKKIPKRKRDSIPLICNEKDIVWVYGISISEDYKVTKETKKILKVSLENLSDR